MPRLGFSPTSPAEAASARLRWYALVGAVLFLGGALALSFSSGLDITGLLTGPVLQFQSGPPSSVSPDYTIPYPANYSGVATTQNSAFANNGSEFYSVRSAGSGFEVLAYSADDGTVLWSSVQPSRFLAARGARSDDSFIVFHTEYVPSSVPDQSFYRMYLSKFSRASNGIPDWTNVINPQISALGFHDLLVSDDGSRIALNGLSTNIQIYDSQGTLIHDLPPPGQSFYPVTMLSLSKDGSSLLGSFFVNAVVYNLNSATPTVPVLIDYIDSSLVRHAKSHAISKDGKYVAYWNGFVSQSAQGFPESISNRIRIFERAANGSYFLQFTDEIGYADLRIPGTDGFPVEQQYYYVWGGVQNAASFNDSDELMVGTTYYPFYIPPDSSYLGTKINLFSYRKNGSGLFERVSRYSNIFPVDSRRVNGRIFIQSVVPFSQSDFLVSFMDSPQLNSPEAIILNIINGGVPKKVFNFPSGGISLGNHPNWMGTNRGGIAPDGSILVYASDFRANAQSAIATNIYGVHPEMIPLNFTATDGLFADRIRVSWDSVAAATGYNVYRSATDDVFGYSIVRLNTNPVTAFSYDDTTGSVGQIYYYWVRAVSGNNEYSFSKSDLGYRAQSLVPPASLTATQTFSNRVDLSWEYPSQPPYNSAIFNVYRSDTPQFSSRGVPYASNITSRTYTDSNPLPPGSNNYYAVVAVSSAGLSSASNTATGFRFLPPSNVTASSAPSSSIDVSWGIPVNPTNSVLGYDLFYTTSSTGCSGTPLSLGPVSSTRLSGLSPSTMYYISLKTRGISETSECSMVVSSISGPAGGPLPSAPTSLAASDGSMPTSVGLTWNAVSGATSYSVYRYEYRGVPFTSNDSVILQENISTNSFTDTSIVPGRQYYYWVKAVNANGHSPFSNQDRGYVLAIPFNTVSYPASQTSITTTWTVSINPTFSVSGYNLYYNTSSEACSGTQVFIPSSTPAVNGTLSNTVSNLVQGTMYYFSLQTRGVDGVSVCTPVTSASPGTAPPVPQNVASGDGTELYTVRVTWDQTSGATEYDLYINHVSNDPSTAYSFAPYGQNISTLSYDTPNNNPGRVYYYFVRARNMFGVSALSAGDGGYILASPSAITASPAPSSSIDVSWTVPVNPPNTVLGYDLFYSNSFTACSGTLVSLGDVSSHRVSGLNPGFIYYFSIRTRGVNGVGGCNYIVSATPGGSSNSPPSAPQNVMASDGGEFWVGLPVSWDSVSQVSSYELYRGSVNNSSTAALVQGNIVNTNFTDLTAAHGQFYYYWVKAVNAYGSSPFSEGDRGLILSIPENLTATATTTNSAIFSWTIPPNPPGTVSGYRVYYNTNESPCNYNGGNGMFPVGNVSSTIVEGLSPNTTYYFSVRTIGTQVGQSLCSSVVSATTSDTQTTPPSAPAGMTASDGTQPGTIDLRWDASNGATSYSIYRSTVNAPPFPSAPAFYSLVTNLSFSDFQATPGRIWYYWVKAVNSAGSSPYSNGDGGYVLAPPTGVSAAPASSSSVTVSWAVPTNPPGSVSGYNLFYGATGTACTGTQISLENVSSSTVSGLSPGTYYFSLQTRGVNGVSTCTPVVTATTAGSSGTTPSAPQNLSAGDGSNPRSVRVTWSSVSGASSYEVYRNTVNNSSTSSLLQGNVTSLSFNDSTATPGMVFYYWVKAVNANGSSPFSNGDGGYLLAWPANVSASQASGSSIAVAWSNPTNPPGSVSGNNLFYNMTGAACSGTMFSLGIVSNNMVSGLTQGSTYYFSLQTRGVNGVSVCSNVASAIIVPLPSGCTVPGSVDNGDGTCGLTLSSILVDGYLAKYGSSWSEVQNATTGSRYQTNTSMSFSSYSSGSPLSYSASRGVIAFDVSSLSGREIAGVTFEGVTGWSSGVSGGSDMIHIMPWAPFYATTGNLDYSDYSRINRQFSSRLASVDISTIPTTFPVQVSFPFNSSGITYFNNSLPSGRLNLGMIEHDSIENYPFTAGRMDLYTSEHATQDNRPRLIVRYNK